MLKTNEQTSKKGYSIVEGKEVAMFDGYIDSQYPDNMRVSMTPRDMMLFMSNTETVMNDFKEFNKMMTDKYQEYKGTIQVDEPEVDNQMNN